MARPTRLTVAKKDITAVLDGAPQKVFSQTQLASLLAEHRGFWRLAQSTNAKDFIAFLQKQGKLRSATLKADAYDREITRYSWGEASIYEIAQSLQSRSYLSHGTAVALLGLNDLLPTTLYVNIEQSPKPPSTGGLTQKGIDLAFSQKQRQSNMTYCFENWSVTVINGKHTGALGVEEIKGQNGETLRTTGLERTLIDIAVRPAYAGGIFQVLQAYQAAREKVSTNRLLATLKKLEYVYPYHQAIGFLMERAGFENKRYSLLKQLGLQHDFYLSHAMKNPEYSTEWRLYYPRGI